MKKLVIFAAVAAVLVLVSGCAPSHTVIEGKNLSAVFFDVGQGDSALLITADGRNVLIDCGEFNDTAFYLKEMNITKIDVLIETHPDNDHIGGCDEARKVAEVGRTLTNENVEEDFILELTETALLEVIVAYDSNGRFDGNNDNSVLLKATYGDVSLLFTGDCGWKCENELARTGEISADILKVGHHGSKYSSTYNFLDKVKPSLAVISAGRNNMYGHPSNETLERLGNYNAAVYRTDANGTAIITTDGRSYSTA